VSGKIGLSEVLARVDINVEDGTPVTFSLGFVKASTGEIKRMAGLRRNVKRPETGGDRSPSSNFRYKLKDRNILLCYDPSANQTFSVKIPLIVEFNGSTVQH